jgi:hypothetical protein
MGHIIVGHGTVDTGVIGRRLLEAASDEDEWELEHEILDFEDWNHTANPCRLLANTYIHGNNHPTSPKIEVESPPITPKSIQVGTCLSRRVIIWRHASDPDNLGH